MNKYSIGDKVIVVADDRLPKLCIGEIGWVYRVYRDGDVEVLFRLEQGGVDYYESEVLPATHWNTALFKINT